MAQIKIMKKVIVIASAILAILYAIGVIIPQVGFLLGKESHGMYSPPAMDFIEIIISLLIILISSLVLFHIKPPNPLRILLIVVAILIALINMAIFGLILFSFIKGYVETFLFIIFCLGSVTVIIASITYIRRALKLAVKENK